MAKLFAILSIVLVTATSFASDFPIKAKRVWEIESPVFFLSQVLVSKDGSCNALVRADLKDNQRVFALQWNLCDGSFTERLSVWSGSPNYPQLGLSASNDLTTVAMGLEVNIVGNAVVLKGERPGESDGFIISPDGKYAASLLSTFGVVPQQRFVELFSLPDGKLIGSLEGKNIRALSWAKDSSHLRALRFGENKETELLQIHLDLSQVISLLAGVSSFRNFSSNSQYVVYEQPRRFYEIATGKSFTPGYNGATSFSDDEVIVADTITKGVAPNLTHFLIVWSSQLNQSQEIQMANRSSIRGLDANSKTLVVSDEKQNVLTIYDLNSLNRSSSFKPCGADEIFSSILVGHRLLVTCQTMPSRQQSIVLFEIEN